MTALILSLLLLFTSCDEVSISEQCLCTELLSKSDCQYNCSWDSTQKKCSEKKTDTTTSTYPVSQLCSNIILKPETDCPITIGCAYYENDEKKSICEQFSGCQAYTKTTNDECQKISTQCTSDGVVCIDPLKCEEYTKETLCLQNISNSGTGKCKWSEKDQKCQDQDCTDAANTLTTDNQCSRFLQGCKSTGKGCVSELQNCSTYSKDDCLDRIGLDGYCYEKDGTCQRIPCVDAPLYSHDKQCEAFQYGCITNGRGCVDAPLQLCSTYQEEGSKCLLLIGSDGKCEGTPDQKVCRARQCKSLNETSLDACNQYQTGCITNGVECTDKLELCSTYSDNCENRIGSDGYCKIGTGSNCQLKLCTDADIKLKTDEECAEFQKGCVTSGAGCVNTRKPCNQYKGTKSTCALIVGSNGRCKGTDDITEANCAVASCSEAPTEYKTHQQCQQFYSNCLSNGAGCEEKTTCLSTASETACKGISSCYWNSICVTAKCDQLNTISICIQNKENGHPCFWTGTSCRKLECTDAPNTYTTNEDCEKFLTGCLTTLSGCIHKLSPCTSYSGKADQCQSFIGNGKRCWGTNNTTKEPCSERLCSIDTNSTTDEDCDKFQFQCKTKGTGCISMTEPCSSYQGDASTCSKFTGSDGKCYNDPANTSACRPLLCTDITDATKDEECSKVLPDCLYGGAGCLLKTEPCTSYSGSSTEICSKFASNGDQCWWESGSNCVVKLCSHNTTATTNKECEEFLKDCVTNGAGCQHFSLECNSYSGTQTVCMSFSGNNKPCTLRSQCSQKSCNELQNPTSNADCVGYMKTCRFDGTKCINALPTCASYTGDSTICQSLSDSNNLGCWLPTGSNGSCVNRQCGDIGSATNQKDCDTFLLGCVFDGTSCQQKQNNCSDYNNFTQDACKNVVTIGGNKCWKNENSTGNCEPISCDNNIDSPSTETCLQYLPTCVFTGTKCTTIQSSCSLYTNFTADSCKSVKKVNGDSCWATADGSCIERQCSDVVAEVGVELTNINCVEYLSTCRLGMANQCIPSKATCAEYSSSFSADVCRRITTSDGQQCWRDDLATNGACEPAKSTCAQYNNATQDLCKMLIDGSGKHCWKSSAGNGICEDRTCSNQIANISQQNCLLHLQSYPSTTQCTYSGVGQMCTLLQDDCQKYNGFTQQACRTAITTLNKKCWKTSAGVGTCENRTCDQNVINPTFENCQAHLATCTYNGQTCQQKENYCASYTNMSPEQCQTILSNIDGKCWSQSTNIGSCIKRQCDHNITSISDIVCEDFLSGCVTNSKGCVLSSNPCTTFSGTTSLCNSFNGCKRDETAIETCGVKTCLDDQDSLTDEDCQKFLSGCVTKGKGCIANTEPCKSYLGVRATCMKYTGNGRRCWNTLDATERTPCVDRQCTDNDYSTTDSDCEAFQYGCVTRGTGCIDKSATCSKYYGSQTTCANFKGLNGQKKCWNIPSAGATQACIDRLCTHNAKLTTDKDCDEFLSGCITKGTGCVNKQSCKNFLGTIKTCPNFSANDKPCKGVSNVVASCEAVNCYEAPNTADSDAACDKFKQSCKTTGFGCVSSIQCEDIQTKSVCQANPNCVYTSNCRDLQNDCSVFRYQSLCVSTPVVGTQTLRCSWHYEGGKGVCGDWKCADASKTITTHDGCKALYKDCTTSGSGCVQIGPCANYITSIVCQAAKTTDKGDTCIWDKTSCRAKKCSDASKAFKTDEKCTGYLKDCQTTGQGCEQPPFACDKIITQARCTVDTLLKPCIWKNAKCVSYRQCSDYSLTTFKDCQEYGEKCISDGTTCQSITLCERYKNEISCIYGTDGVCGWLPPNGSDPAKCVLFKECQQATSSDNIICGQFSSSCTTYKHKLCSSLPICVSDGKQCFPKGKCETYLTEQACSNMGNDGKCFWEVKDSNTKCRLRECTDATIQNANNIVTHQSCNSFQAVKQCTTNSTGCIDMNKCEKYDKNSCFQGTDGECIFDKEKCRIKICTDFKETTTATCNLKLKGCISDGTNCLDQSKCETYKTLVACRSSGTDGLCVWNQVKNEDNTTTSICKLMSKCEDAHQDQVACEQQKQTCVYSLNTTSKVSTCVSHTCSSLAVGTNCFPIYSVDQKKATICIPNPNANSTSSTNSTSGTNSTSSTNTTCVPGQASSLQQSNCYGYSAYTYTYDSDSSKCVQCKKTTTNTSTNTTPSNTTNTTEDDGGRIKTIAGLLIIFVAF